MLNAVAFSKISLFATFFCQVSFIRSMMCAKPVVLVHGGAGDIPDSRVTPKLDGVKNSALEGYKVLKEKNNSLDAIEAAIHIMEDDEAFNAGRGSVLTLDGKVEMEALLMEGASLKIGSATLMKNVAHPISVARLIMEKTPHCFLGGEGLEHFIEEMKVPRVPDDYLITQNAIDALEEFKKSGHKPNRTEIGNRPGDVGTVGCVVVTEQGHVASGTSTGGITGKYTGRIGDTPLPGCGGYSDDNVGAVSTTGHGESILKYNLAGKILNHMERGESAQNATALACEGMTQRVGKTAGAITVSNKGDVGISFTSKRMAWAYRIDNELHFGIEAGQHLIETVE